MSRQRSGRGASAPAAGGRSASRPVGGGRGSATAPTSDIYVALLGISLAAMLIGCLLLFLILNRYDNTKFTVQHTAPAPMATGLAVLETADHTGILTGTC